MLGCQEKSGGLPVLNLLNALEAECAIRSHFPFKLFSFYFLFLQDVQYGDIDHMDRHVDFTFNKKSYSGLPEFVRSNKKDGLRYIIILVSS